MQVDARLVVRTLHEVPAVARAAERLGFDGLWANEINHDPFLAVALAAEHSTHLVLGTAIALAFTRSPTTLAYTAWDLGQLSGGRFVLGLGTQVKAHVTRRFGQTWAPPVPRLRDVIGALRAVWATWTDGRPLAYHGRYITLSLMTPFFVPPGPPVPLRIAVAGVGARMCRLAGEVADGFHVHPFHTRRYLREVILPQITEGLRRAGRARREISIAASVFVATGTAADVAEGLQEVRRSLAFYASTPTYRPVLALHGWDDLGARLSRHAARGEWDALPGLIPDDLLAAAAIWGPPDDVAAQLRAEYGGQFDRLGLYEPLVPGRREAAWRALLDGLRR
ncbi:MAG: TIGR03617 family F420-dependent LLM class oxidoreductase [Armatimonadota bacterium]|nr:TIGR03617 family F420-dependent LLM class oxidoreductase [Armatimonadota bacterium]MDR7532955.1 TIGR03617 family F420-dependent LLM class oxidoreductase [Armatimonadota bacterium]MDR7537539.1 TIGR03617 family F420-dependent LLM class oxidoreductase [Armatimonadota bacterium]